MKETRCNKNGFLEVHRNCSKGEYNLNVFEGFNYYYYGIELKLKKTTGILIQVFIHKIDRI